MEFVIDIDIESQNKKKYQLPFYEISDFNENNSENFLINPIDSDYLYIESNKIT